jgi:hypothetical protein
MVRDNGNEQEHGLAPSRPSLLRHCPLWALRVCSRVLRANAAAIAASLSDGLGGVPTLVCDPGGFR